MFGRAHDRTRFLLVGYGPRGRQWHRETRRRRDLDVAGAADPDASAQAEARRRGIRAWPSLNEAAAEAAAHAAIVSSPPWEHSEQVITCLHLGMAVLVEKPLALSLAGAAAVAEESQRAGRPVVVGQNFRFLPRERAIRKALAAGAIGRPLSAVIVSARPGTVARAHLASVEHGPVWDICLHHLDALRIRFGGLPDAVQARIQRVSEAPVRQRFELSLRWPDGLSVTYQHSEGAPGFYHFEWIEGEHRAMLVHDQNVSLVFPRQRPRRVAPPRGPSPEQAVLQDFLGALWGEAPSTMSAGENLGTVATVEAVLRSAALGQEVSVSEIVGESGVGVAERGTT